MSDHERTVPRCGTVRPAATRRTVLTLFGLTVGAATVAGMTITMAAEVAEVHIDNFAFTPSVLTIVAGTTVRWTNRDDIPHTVVEKGIAWRSKAMDTDDTFEHTFDAPGEVEYFCSLHPHMTGKVVVKPD